ncbi:MAG: putative Ig domain-containing protein [Anaeromyxobacteraceae bacterium]
MNPSSMHARSVRGSLLALVASTALLAGCSSSSGGGLQPPAGLHYADATPIFTMGAAVTPDVPSVSGGAVPSWSVSPALPAGLTLGTTTGVISGTPTTPSAVTPYVVTATNAAGSTTAGITITVNHAVTPPTGLTYLHNPVIYTMSQAIVPNTPSTSGGQPTSYAVTPALPAGLSLDPSTGIVSGTPTTPASVATYTVTASNAGGSAPVGLVITVSQSPQPPGTLSYSSMNPSYPAGTPVLNTPTVTGGQATSYAVTPTLPPGLSLNATTGVISGTPTTPANVASYVVTASNAAGSAPVTLDITVTSSVAAPTAITYAFPSPTYPAGVAISQNQPTVTGGTPTSWTVAPPLPPGLVLDPGTGAITGTPSTVSSATPYVITGSNAGGSAQATVTITVTLTAGQLAIMVNQVAKTDTTVNTTYTAVGSGPYSVVLRGLLYQSGGITMSDSAYINFSVSGSGIYLDNNPATQSLQCQVTSANPGCDMIVNLTSASPSTPYVVTVNVAGAFVSPVNPYRNIAVVLTPDTTPGPGTVVLGATAPSGPDTYLLPSGMNAPLFVNWKNPATIGTVSVDLTISGGASFYWYTPGNNSTIQTGPSQTCTLTFTGGTGSQLSCGFGVRANQAASPGQTATVTLDATGSWGYTYPTSTLTFAIQAPQPATRTVQFVNNSSQQLWVGITGGGAYSYVDPKNTYAPPGASTTGKPAGGSSLCGPSTTPPNVAACPIGTTCIQGGQNPQASSTFECYYDQPVPASGYLLAPGGGAGSTATITISGSSVSPQGIIWSGNFYGRTGCNTTDPTQAGVCENAKCVGATPGFGCGPGTGPAPGVNTLAEATFQATGQPDYYDVSIINGANFAVQFAPTVQGAKGYTCGQAGSKQAQTGGIGAAGWTMNVGAQNYPPVPPSTTPVPVNGDPSTYYTMVSSSATQTCTRTAGNTAAGGCASFPGTSCGFRVSDMTGTFDVATRYCGTPLGWVTADAMYGFVAKATPVPANPFYFLTNPSGVVTLGNLQICEGNSYSSYQPNWPGPIQAVALACGGVMWGPTETVNQNPAGNVGLGITQPAQQVQTANADWLDYVLPTIKWMKQACPSCYTYPFDDMSSTFTCQDSTGQGLTYTVQFSDLAYAPPQSNLR